MDFIFAAPVVKDGVAAPFDEAKFQELVEASDSKNLDESVLNGKLGLVMYAKHCYDGVTVEWGFKHAEGGVAVPPMYHAVLAGKIPAAQVLARSVAAKEKKISVTGTQPKRAKIEAKPAVAAVAGKPAVAAVAEEKDAAGKVTKAAVAAQDEVKAVEAQEVVEEEAEVKADISSTQEIDCYALAKNSDDLDIVNMYRNTMDPRRLSHSICNIQ